MTLVELLVTITIIGILASLLLTAISKSQPRANRATCLGNLHQTGVGFTMSANENGDFPMAVPVSAGGVKELRPKGVAVDEFLAAYRCLSNELGTPRILACPADTRQPAVDFAHFGKTNLSYFVGLGASILQPRSVLAGDRNVVVATNGTLNWTSALHGNQGDILMADGHVEQQSSEKKQSSAGVVVQVTPDTPVVSVPMRTGETNYRADGTAPHGRGGLIQLPPNFKPPTVVLKSSSGSNRPFAKAVRREKLGDIPGHLAYQGGTVTNVDTNTNSAEDAIAEERADDPAGEMVGTGMRLAQVAILTTAGLSGTLAFIIMVLMLIKFLHRRRARMNAFRESLRDPQVEH